MIGQTLRGFVGQSMSGQRSVFRPFDTNYPVGSWTFTAPAPGQYKFIMWGAGGFGQNVGNSGGSGAYCEYSRWMSVGETAALVVGAAYGSSHDATATFRDGKVVTAGGANNATAGTASGGDVNLNGTAGGTPGGAGAGTGGGAVGAGAIGGSGAPANLPYRGGNGGDNVNAAGATPGGGGPAQSVSSGGDGLILVTRTA